MSIFSYITLQLKKTVHHPRNYCIYNFTIFNVVQFHLKDCKIILFHPVFLLKNGDFCCIIHNREIYVWKVDFYVSLIIKTPR